MGQRCATSQPAALGCLLHASSPRAALRLPSSWPHTRAAATPSPAHQPSSPRRLSAGSSCASMKADRAASRPCPPRDFSSGQRPSAAHTFLFARKGERSSWPSVKWRDERTQRAQRPGLHCQARTAQGRQAMLWNKAKLDYSVGSLAGEGVQPPGVPDLHLSRRQSQRQLLQHQMLLHATTAAVAAAAGKRWWRPRLHSCCSATSSSAWSAVASSGSGSGRQPQAALQLGRQRRSVARLSAVCRHHKAVDFDIPAGEAHAQQHLRLAPHNQEAGSRQEPAACFPWSALVCCCWGPSWQSQPTATGPPATTSLRTLPHHKAAAATRPAEMETGWAQRLKAERGQRLGIRQCGHGCVGGHSRSARPRSIPLACLHVCAAVVLQQRHQVPAWRGAQKPAL